MSNCFFQLLRNKNPSSNIFYNTISVVGIREGVKGGGELLFPCPPHCTAATGKVPLAPELEEWGDCTWKARFPLVQRHVSRLSGSRKKGERRWWSRAFLGWSQVWFLCSSWKGVSFKWPVTNAFLCCPLLTWENSKEMFIFLAVSFVSSFQWS